MFNETLDAALNGGKQPILSLLLFIKTPLRTSQSSGRWVNSHGQLVYSMTMYYQFHHKNVWKDRQDNKYNGGFPPFRIVIHIEKNQTRLFLALNNTKFQKHC